MYFFLTEKEYSTAYQCSSYYKLFHFAATSIKEIYFVYIPLDPHKLKCVLLAKIQGTDFVSLFSSKKECNITIQ